MSAETSKPAEPVHDGIQNTVDPIPKESSGSPGASPATGGPAGAPDGPRDTASSGDDGGAQDPTGPAEEQDDASPDDRGLATELGPSD